MGIDAALARELDLGLDVAVSAGVAVIFIHPISDPISRRCPGRNPIARSLGIAIAKMPK